MSQKPSQLLHSLVSVHNTKEILRTQVYPFLDSLPADQTASLVKSLKEVATKLKGPGLIAYDANKKSIEHGLKTLRKSAEQSSRRYVSEVWIDGFLYLYVVFKRYQDDELLLQADAVEEIVDEITTWVPTLWGVAVELGTEHGLVHNCLIYCHETLEELRDTANEYV